MTKETELGALEGLPDSFPGNPLDQLSEYEKKTKDSENRVKELEQRKNSIAESFHDNPELEKLLPHADEIAALKEMEPEYRNLATQIDDLKERKEYFDKKQKSIVMQKSIGLQYVAAIFILVSVVMFFLDNRNIAWVHGIAGVALFVAGHFLKKRQTFLYDTYDIRTLENQLNSKVALAQEFNDRAAELLDKIDLDSGDDSGEVSALDNLLQKYASLQKYQTGKDTLAKRLADVDDLIRQEMKNGEDVQHLKLQYLKKYTSSELCDNLERMESEISRLAGVQEQRKKLNSEIENIRNRIATLGESSGREDDSFLEYLRQADLEKLAGEKKLIDEEIARLDAELDSINHDSGSTENQMKMLRERESQAQELVEKRERLKSELEPLVERWCALKLAGYAADNAREVFEREHQPELTRLASGIFKGMTGARYESVRALIDGEQITVLTSTGKSLPPEKLSRGTAEQLYLSLRFAYIIQRAKSSEPLPVIMDDILVNFDSERAATAVGEIERLADSHQVIYFTCHSHVKEMFEKEIEGVNVIEL